MKRNLIIILSAISIITLGIFLFVFIVNDLFGGLTSSSRNIEKILSNKVEIVKITIDENAEHPYTMDLKMSGKINGLGKLSFGWNDSLFYRTDTISNDYLVDYKHGDWYNDNCIIKYEPITATKGELKIDCRIYSSKKERNDKTKKF